MAVLSTIGDGLWAAFQLAWEVTWVLVRLRRDSDREVDVRQRRELRLGDVVPVRLDEPRLRARDRDLGLHRLAIHAGRARRRSDPDRADVARTAAVRDAAPGG